MVNPITMFFHFLTIRTNYELSKHERRVAKKLQRLVGHFPKLEELFTKAETAGSVEECKKHIEEIMQYLKKEEDELSDIERGEQIIQKRSAETYMKDEHEIGEIMDIMKKTMLQYQHLDPTTKKLVEEGMDKRFKSAESQLEKVKKEMEQVKSNVEGLIFQERRALIHDVKDREGIVRYLAAFRGGETGIAHHIYNLLRYERRLEKQIRGDEYKVNEEEKDVEKDLKAIAGILKQLLEHDNKVINPVELAKRFKKLTAEDERYIEKLIPIIERYNADFEREAQRIEEIIRFSVIMNFHILHRIQRVKQRLAQLGAKGYPHESLAVLQSKEKEIETEVNESFMVAFRGATYVRSATS